MKIEEKQGGIKKWNFEEDIIALSYEKFGNKGWVDRDLPFLQLQIFYLLSLIY